MSAVSSILHRFTGVALYLGTVIWVWWLLAAAVSDDAYDSAAWFIGSWIGQIIMLGWTWSIFFHLGNGIRHLAWDAGWGFDLKTVSVTNWFVMLFAFGMTLAAWIAGYIVWFA